jgi:hypothetical protein
VASEMVPVAVAVVEVAVDRGRNAERAAAIMSVFLLLGQIEMN